MDIFIHSTPNEFCHGCLLSLLQLKIALKSIGINARIFANSDGVTMPKFLELIQERQERGSPGYDNAIPNMVSILSNHLNENFNNVVNEYDLQDKIIEFFSILSDKHRGDGEAIEMLSELW